MASDDPFYNPDDLDKTILRPTPGGARPTPGAGTPPASTEFPQPDPNQVAPSAAVPPSPGAAAVSSLGTTRTGANVITDTAAQLLALIGRLKSTTQHNDIAALHRQVVQAVQNFENNARQMGATPETLLISRYGLCAAIDETVLNTPWGSSSIWSSHSMLSTFHKETGGGEKFFQILDRIRQESAKNIDMIELYAIILALGFEGKYRIQANGKSYLDNLRDELFNTIRQQRGEFERELSPRWRGIKARVNTLADQVPLWVIGALTGVIMLSVYFGFNLMLHSGAGPSFDKFESMAPAALIEGKEKQ